ncbi:MAG TPA: hypothetical protein DEV80_08590, partial [Alcanivorax sp.]|nr:hypothetical protein [Alcanivorax sp.]
ATRATRRRPICPRCASTGPSPSTAGPSPRWRYSSNHKALNHRSPAVTEPRFVHLRVHTDYSLVDGVARVKELIKASVDQRMPAVAVTDENNLFALIKFYSGAMGAGLKPIMGADLWLQADDPEDEPHYLCCLVQNETGYLNL